MSSELRKNGIRQRHRSVFLAFAVLNGQNARIEIHAMHAKTQTFKEPESTPIKQFYNKVIRRLQVLQNNVDLFTGQDNRDIRFSLGPDNSVDLSEFLFQGVTIEKQERIESLILRGR